MAKVGRNAPCPCGSGKKYKRCCGSIEASPAPRTRAPEAPTMGRAEATPPRPEPRWVLPVTALGVGGLAVWVGLNVSAQGAVAVAAAGAFAFGASRIFRDPPPPNDNAGNPSGINFGH